MSLLALLNHKRLQEEMKLNGLKQEEFAEALGITDRHIRNLISKDTDVSTSLLYRISVELHIPMEDLLVLREDPDFNK